MDIQLTDHPEVTSYLDNSLSYDPTAKTVTRSDRTFVEVRQKSEFEGDVVIFVEEGALPACHD